MANSKNILLRSKKRAAEELLRAKRLPEARDAYMQLCHQAPHDYESWVNLGVINGRLGILDAAESALVKALSLRSDEPQIYVNLIRLCEMQGRLSDAVNHCQSYLGLKPNDAEAYTRMGMLLHKMGRLDDAERALRQTLKINPANATYHNNVGLILSDLGRHDEALSCYQSALQLNPSMDEAHCNLGDLYRKQDKIEAAERSYADALNINPRNTHAYTNLGFCCLVSGRHHDAMRCFGEVLKIEPDNVCIRWNNALLLLVTGDFRNGWREYEWRFQYDNIKHPEMTARYRSRPQWDGAPLSNTPLLLYVEQGFGDALQFCRYLPLVMARVDHLIFECQPELQRLLSHNFSTVQLLSRPASGAMPDVNYGVQIPLMSLPRLFETELESVPRQLPYIHAEAELVEQWQQRFEGDEFRVGLVWAGNPEHGNDQLRSISLATLAPLAKAPGVVFYSLQKGRAAAEAATPPDSMRLIDWSVELNDFADTAALIANLDLVITVDTSVAHLAGAMGKRVWTLIYSPPDWRWLLDRDDSPWYPTMRLFRQSVSGEWGPVVEQVAQALAQIRSLK